MPVVMNRGGDNGGGKPAKKAAGARKPSKAAARKRAKAGLSPAQQKTVTVALGLITLVAVLCLGFYILNGKPAPSADNMPRGAVTATSVTPPPAGPPRAARPAAPLQPAPGAGPIVGEHPETPSSRDGEGAEPPGIH